MTHKRLLASAAIIAFVLIIGFMLSVPHTRDIIQPPASPSETASIPPVKLHDIFKKGTHTITGTIRTPNACTAVSAIASITGASSTPSIQVAVSLPKDTGVCLQLPVMKTFSVTVVAPAGLPISAIVNGAEAVTSVL